MGLPPTSQPPGSRLPGSPGVGRVPVWGSSRPRRHRSCAGPFSTGRTPVAPGRPGRAAFRLQSAGLPSVPQASGRRGWGWGGVGAERSPHPDLPPPPRPGAPPPPPRSPKGKGAERGLGRRRAQEVREELEGREGGGLGEGAGGGRGGGAGEAPAPGRGPSGPQVPIAGCPHRARQEGRRQRGRGERRAGGERSEKRFISATKAYFFRQGCLCSYLMAAPWPGAQRPQTRSAGRQLSARGPYLEPDIKAGLFVSELKQHTHRPGTGRAISPEWGGRGAPGAPGTLLRSHCSLSDSMKYFAQSSL